MQPTNDGIADRRIGELAAGTGLSVRTLRYYEEIGLVPPSGRSDAGHRLYADRDVERLYQVCSLRKLGLSLAEIARALDDPEWNLAKTVSRHLRELEQEMEDQQRLRNRLTQLIGATQEHAVSTTDLLTILEDMTMLNANVQRRISILTYRDIVIAYEHLGRVFQLGPGELTTDEHGAAVHGEIEAGDGVVWLHPESADFGLASPNTLGGSTASLGVIVDDVDAHFAHAKSEGAVIEYEPTNQPYGYREYSARDTEGHLWSFMKPIADIN